MKNIYLIVLLFVVNWASAQATKEEIFNNIEKTAGVYFAYPEKEIRPQTPVPAGYEPFYISHFGRHGSRYLISDDEYKNMIDLFEAAEKNNALTGLGKEVLKRLKQLWKEVEWRGGDLSPLGIREQRGIAERMYRTYPEVFTNESKMAACATTIVRCVLSMDAFCERLKELNPSLSISRNSGMKWQRYLNHHTKKAIAYRSADDTWKPGYKQFESAHVHPDRLIKSLFTGKSFLAKSPETVMWALFGIAGGMQNVETKGSFYDIFTKDELFDLWQCKNYKTYVNDANSALSKGIMMDNAKPLLRSIIDSAEQIIASKGKGADFSFAHDGNIIPLAMLLHLDGTYNSVSDAVNVYKAWCDFKVAPMAGNIQIIFFRKNDSNDILVKFLHNENEVSIPPVKTDRYPYYHWKDIVQYYRGLLQDFSF
ncbi:histidine-type phosphatase [Niabella aquatica]